MKEFILSLFFGPRLSLTAQQSFAICGVVVDSKTQQPLEGVNIVGAKSASLLYSRMRLPVSLVRLVNALLLGIFLTPMGVQLHHGFEAEHEVKCEQSDHHFHQAKPKCWINHMRLAPMQLQVPLVFQPWIPVETSKKTAFFKPYLAYFYQPKNPLRAPP